MPLLCPSPFLIPHFTRSRLLLLACGGEHGDHENDKRASWARNRSLNPCGGCDHQDQYCAAGILKSNTDAICGAVEKWRWKGNGLDLIRQFPNLVPPRTQWGDSSDSPETEVIVDDSYFVTGVGTVIGGTVTRGRLRSGETMLFGPDGNGQFRCYQEYS